MQTLKRVGRLYAMRAKTATKAQTPLPQATGQGPSPFRLSTAGRRGQLAGPATFLLPRIFAEFQFWVRTWPQCFGLHEPGFPRCLHTVQPRFQVKSQGQLTALIQSSGPATRAKLSSFKGMPRKSQSPKAKLLYLPILASVGRTW
jgi:hypothetical protein